jgi:hypothetical protein
MVVPSPARWVLSLCREMQTSIGNQLYSFSISKRGQWSGGDAECAKAGPLRSGPPIALLSCARFNLPATWLASVNAAYLGEYADRNSAMLRVENDIQQQMEMALHDWKLYRAAKGGDLAAD